MEGKWLMHFLLGCMCLHPGIAETCPDEPNGFVFERLIHGYYSGPLLQMSRRPDTFLASLGSCNATVVDDMIKYYASYGINVEHLRRTPFRQYDGPDFSILLTDDISQVIPTIVYDVSYYTHTKFLNARAFWASWYLTVKRDFRGQKGMVPKGFSLEYGMTRFKLENEYQCISYGSKSPIDGSIYSGTKITVLEDVAYHSSWGVGSFFTYAQLSNTTVHYTMSMNFPAYLE